MGTANTHLNAPKTTPSFISFLIETFMVSIHADLLGYLNV